MLGTPAGDGEMDAMQLSIVSETVAQISSAMAERLTQQLKVASENIVSTVPTEARSISGPAVYIVSRRSSTWPASSASTWRSTSTASRWPRSNPRPLRRRRRRRRPSACAAARGRGRAAAASRPAAFAPLPPTPIRAAPPGKANLDSVHDIPLEISAVLGQTEMSLRDVVALQSGSVLELDKLSSDPIDLYVNDILIARGEVVVVDDKFAIKISELNPAIDKV